MILPQTMMYIAVREPGGAEKLQAAQMPVPQPATGQVLIRVMAVGVNRADLLQRAGNYPPPAGESDILGLEVSGEIVAIGADVTAWKKGDVVCALLASGGYAEYVTAHAALCLPIPSGVSMIDAAGLPEAAFTAMSNLMLTGQLRAGETVLIHAGGSGVGTFAIQLAHAIGARLFTTVGTDEKQDFCRDLGAEIAINYRREDFISKIMAATDGRGVDVILDMIGGATTEKNIGLLATDGRLLLIAYPDGPRAQLHLPTLLQKRLHIIGTTLRARPLSQKSAIAAAVKAEVWPLIAAGKIRPVTYQTLKLTEAAIAHRILESRQHIGKIILTVS